MSVWILAVFKCRVKFVGPEEPLKVLEHKGQRTSGGLVVEKVEDGHDEGGVVEEMEKLSQSPDHGVAIGDDDDIVDGDGTASSSFPSKLSVAKPDSGRRPPLDWFDVSNAGPLYWI